MTDTATTTRALTEGVLMLDTNGVIRWANPAASEISGYSAEEMIGKTPSLFTGVTTQPPSSNELQETLKRENSWSGEFCGTSKNNELFRVHLTVTPARNKSGQVSHYIVNAIRQAGTNQPMTTPEAREASGTP